MRKRELKDVKVGDIFICDNSPDHDYETYILVIESVEKEEEFITEINPEGILAYGKGYTKEEDEYIDSAGYTFRCSEENFVDFYIDEDTAEKIHIELNNDTTLVVIHTNGKILSYVVMGTGADRTNEIVGFVSVKEEQDLVGWVLRKEGEC